MQRKSTKWVIYDEIAEIPERMLDQDGETISVIAEYSPTPAKKSAFYRCSATKGQSNWFYQQLKATESSDKREK